MPCFVPNLLGYMCINNYSNTERFDTVNAKIKWCSFLPHIVVRNCIQFIPCNIEIQKTRLTCNKYQYGEWSCCLETAGRHSNGIRSVVLSNCYRIVIVIGKRTRYGIRAKRSFFRRRVVYTHSTVHGCVRATGALLFGGHASRTTGSNTIQRRCHGAHSTPIKPFSLLNV